MVDSRERERKYVCSNSTKYELFSCNTVTIYTFVATFTSGTTLNWRPQFDRLFLLRKQGW